MKLKTTELSRMIGEMVRAELKKALPAMVNEVLSERYIQRLVSEQASRRPRAGSLAEVLEDDGEEEIPQPLANSSKGIYARNPLAKGIDDDEEEAKDRQRPTEATSRLTSAENPLSFLYEGTAPLSKQTTGGPDVPLEKLGIDFEKMRELSQGMDAIATQRRPMSNPLRRQAIEPAPRPPVARPRNPLLEGFEFPDKPIVLE